MLLLALVPLLFPLLVATAATGGGAGDKVAWPVAGYALLCIPLMIALASLLPLFCSPIFAIAAPETETLTK
jgi:hypothetical protein